MNLRVIGPALFSLLLTCVTPPSLADSGPLLRPDPGNILWGRRSGDLEVGISIPRTSFSVGEEIPLSVSIKNVGSGLVSLGRTAAVFDDNFELLNSRGEAVPRSSTRFTYLGSGPDPDVARLPPNLVQTETTDLTKMFDLGVGSYSIRISRPTHIPGSAAESAIPVSQTIRFEVH